MAKKSARSSLLCDDELSLILSKIRDPADRKSFSEVCKQWLRVEGLSRTSIRLLRPDFLRQVLPRFPNLLTFETSNSISDTDLEFISHTCPNIEVLNLNMVATSFDLGVKCFGLPTLANKCPKLSKVILRGRSCITDPISVSLINSARNLTHLDLGCCFEVSDKALKAIGSANSISYLNLEWCVNITDVGLGFLANGSCSNTLKTLILAWCERIGDVGVSQLRKLQCLEQLSLAHCGKKITDTGGVAISAISTLKKLSLVRLKSVSEYTIVSLAANCLDLEELDLSELKLSRVSRRAFSSHKCLQRIVLRFCRFGVDDLEHLMHGCESLKSIGLDYETSMRKRPLMQEGTRRLVKHIWCLDANH